MPKGIIKLSKSNRGNIIVSLDRLNGKPPMPLSYVAFKDLSHNDKECEYGFENGRVTYIKIENEQVYPSVPLVNIQRPQQGGQHIVQQIQQPQGNRFADSLDIQQTLLAKDVRQVNVNDIDNFNLKLYKAQRYLKDKGKFYFFKNDKRRSREGLETGHSFLIQPKYGDLQFEQIKKRLEYQVQTLYPNNNEKIEFKPDWRLIVGIGSGSVYEVGMTLHHIYGCPYIPASSIKGLVRSWLIQNCFDMDEGKAFQSKLMCDIFGAPDKFKDDNTFYKINEKEYGYAEKQGNVIFFDAFPINPPSIEVDIMNVHYPDYYNDSDNKKNTAPTDFQSPNPIPFLTVGNKDLNGNDLKFVTYIAVKENKMISEMDTNYKNLLSNDMSVLEFVSIWLKKALTEHGIGAKTAVGYGYMKND
jgi:CRISPR-associated protein Cmr6